MQLNKIYLGDSLTILKSWPDEFVDCVITSPPYWGLRDYGVAGQLGLEKTPEEYVAKMVEIFREVKRVLKPTGTCWLNLGDSYAGSGKGQTPEGSNDPKQPKLPVHRPGKNSFGVGDKHRTSQVAMRAAENGFTPGLKCKDLVGIPWRVAFALQADGWYLRQDLIWHKPNPMPESVTDRCTKSHEYIFLLAKSQKYYFDNEAIKEKAVYAGEDRGKSRNISPDGMSEMDNKQYDDRNKRSVWTINTKLFKEAHFATFPEKLIEPMVKAGCPLNGIVLDPFSGAGTTALVARNLGRQYLGCELNAEYIKITEKRLAQQILL